ncbi:carbohydrate ABC transporter permease [Caldanaerobius polysaccharolyticus]|uniref:carbohydrate ABC transporter permease n=1 Tax=Caldanaerobius polysaccharolyticus TaxID=44256 RepID=UPI00047BDDEC|nr:carbohydrate ABC transporter permease [Caldanaerobius polysaccharolyticus]
MHKNKKVPKTLKYLLSYIMLGILTIVFIFPFIWMVSTSLRLPDEAYTFPPKLIPKTITLDNFIQGWQFANFTRYTLNTIIIAITATIGAVFSSALVAYGFARFKSRFSGLLFTIVLATMMLPSQVTLIPTYLLFSKLGWIDTFLPLIVPSFFGGGAFNIFLLRQFFKTIPREFDEAALIDGANSFQIFYKILLPMIKPALTTVAVMSITYHWNDFFSPLVYLNSDEKFTLAIGLQFFRSSYGSTQIPMLMAVSFITIIPVLILFFAAQRYFVQGITMTGIKG